MPEHSDLPRPVMRRPAGLDAHQTTRKLGDDVQHLISAQAFSQNDLARGIDAVQMKLGPGDIDPKCFSFHMDGACSFVGR